MGRGARIGAAAALVLFGAPLHAALAAGMVRGVVISADGAALARARVEAAGNVALTGADGTFALPCRAGAVELRAERAGFEPVRAAGTCGTSLTLVLPAATLTSIGRVGTTGERVPFNTSPGAVAVIDRTHIDDRNALQIGRLLDETPGAVSAHAGTANPAVPGAQTSPNLRGTLDYEKTTLIDGHPVANGSHGDYVTTYLAAFLLRDIEVAKGPGADAPLVVSGVGGSINFRTREPSLRPIAGFDAGADGFGGTVLHALSSGTYGRLGYVVDAVDYATPGAFTNTGTVVALPSGTRIAGTGTIAATTSALPPASTPPGAFPVAGALVNPANAYVTLAACCEFLDAAYRARGEVVKARWRFSDTMSLTAAYVGTHAASDNDAATLQSLAAVFAPSGAALTLNPATHLPANQTLTENEPLFEAEFRSAVSPRDTLVARWYALALGRISGNAVTSPATPFTGTLQLTGTAPLVGGGAATFAGETALVTIPNVYARSVEEDATHGGSMALDHAAGPNVYTLSLDRWTATTNAYAITANAGAAVVTPSIPAGSLQTITSVLARAHLRLGARDDLTLAGYVTLDHRRFAVSANASGTTFAQATAGHTDPRLGFTHRFTSDAVVRFAAGSSITPPNIGLVSALSTAPAFTPGATSITVTRNAGSLLPETAFGYDAGADLRVRPDAVLSFDAYTTTLRNQFASTVMQAGTFAPPSGGAPIPVFATANVNAGNARFYGLEASLRSDPRTGFGFRVQGALVRSYAYDLSPALYATATSPFGTNLAVLPNVNYESTGTGFNGFSNKGIPYAQAYAEAHFRTPRGGLLLLGETYYGNNNSWNQRAFGVGNAALRFALGAPAARTWLQFSADNLWNAFPATSVTTAGGVPVPLANGALGLVNALPLGPRTVRIDLHAGAP